MRTRRKDQMQRVGFKALTGLSALLCALLGPPAGAQHEEVLKKLNGDDTVQGTDESKSFRVLFDAYLELDPPPLEVGDGFNLSSIHPDMREWDAVSDWAESSGHMAEAIQKCKTRNIIGLPYGAGEVSGAYRQADLVAAIGVGGSLRQTEFPYLRAMDTIAAYATAEMYRRLEAGQIQPALDLATAHNWVLRQLCDRQFLGEKMHSMQLLIRALASLRDVFYTYQDSIEADQYFELSWYDIPDLRVDRKRLQIPEGDKIISEALLEEVFDHREQADPQQFARAFAWIQAADAPLTQFGAAKRWSMIAEVHGSLEASKERLTLIYDDWWRRWQVQAYDPILDISTQFVRTNPVRYAAVIYSMQNIQEVFTLRNQLAAAVNGSAIAAGLCAYKRTFGVYPDQTEKLYGQFVRKLISDIDPYDEQYGPLRYRLLQGRHSVDTLAGRLWIDAGECVVYGLGQDHEDNLAAEHSDDGAVGDLVLWPPTTVLSRKQGVID
ncbi:MAG: hypothetical protein O6768_01245 [Planctomycetota bacterium]|nr:hypothetical protein [Planctomycetota bacterium]